MTVLGNARVITWSDSTPFFDDGAVAIEGEKIVDVGATEEIKARHGGAQFVDCKRKVLMPGLINAHQHIYSQFARGLNMGNPPAKGFLDILKNVWWRLDKKLTLEDTKYSAYATLIEAVRSGCTTTFDHHASPFHIEGSLSTIGEAAKALGVRASLCYEVSDRDGKEIFERGVQENIGWIREANSSGQHKLRGMFGLHASFTLSGQSMEFCAKAMQGADAGYHVHVAEGISDVYDSVQKYGKRVVNRLYDYGMLGENTFCVHCVHISDAEIDILRQTKTKAVNNPQSNMNNAVGCAPVLRMLEKGVPVGLGTDGMTANMFESVKTEPLIQRHNLCDPNVAFAETGKMAFCHNAEFASHFFGEKIGKIEKGCAADLIVVDYDPPTAILPSNCLGHVIFGMSGRDVDDVMVAGKFIMRERKILTVDEREIFATARETADRLWKRI